MSDIVAPIDLTPDEERVLALYAWLETRRLKYLLRAVDMAQPTFAAAEDRLLAIGFIAPDIKVTRQ